MPKCIDTDNLEVLTEHGVTRRRLLQAGLGAGILLATPIVSAAYSPRSYEKRLSLLNLHTGERVKTAYWEKGKYIPEALREISKVLRDHRSGERYPMDPKLLDLIQFLQHKMGSSKELQVISGYRSPSTNAMLALQSNGVAKRSLHMQGKAIDIRLPGVSLNALRRAAMSVRRGGVGYYPESDFIHVDTGDVRYW